MYIRYQGRIQNSWKEGSILTRGDWAYVDRVASHDEGPGGCGRWMFHFSFTSSMLHIVDCGDRDTEYFIVY